MHLSFFIFIILGVTSCAVVNAAPSNIGASLIMNSNNLCDYECPRNYIPVCAVDSSGVPRTFGNKCIAGLMYCYERKYYAIVKEGEC